VALRPGYCQTTFHPPLPVQTSLFLRVYDESGFRLVPERELYAFDRPSIFGKRYAKHSGRSNWFVSYLAEICWLRHPQLCLCRAKVRSTNID
jgi:hypothetical protein